MKCSSIVLVIALSIVSTAEAATLTITPDKAVYQVGEQIVLNVLGDSEGALDNAIFGRILFDPSLATYVSSSQEPLTSFLLFIVWPLGPAPGGVGFGTAFHQLVEASPIPVDAPLTAQVILSASAPGTLTYAWQTDGELDLRLDFFGLTTAPGGSVTIVPEPATGLLVVLGLIAFTRRR